MGAYSSHFYRYTLNSICFPVGRSTSIRSFPPIASTYFFMVEILRSLPRFSIAERDGCLTPRISANSSRIRWIWVYKSSSSAIFWIRTWFSGKRLTNNSCKVLTIRSQYVEPFYIGLCVIPLEFDPFLEQFSYSYFWKHPVPLFLIIGLRF